MSKSAPVPPEESSTPEPEDADRKWRHAGRPGKEYMEQFRKSPSPSSVPVEEPTPRDPDVENVETMSFQEIRRKESCARCGSRDWTWRAGPNPPPPNVCSECESPRSPSPPVEEPAPAQKAMDEFDAKYFPKNGGAPARPVSPPVEAPEKLDERLLLDAETEGLFDRCVMSVQFSPDEHPSDAFDALRQRIRTLVSEAQREGYRMRMNDMRISDDD